MVSVYHLHRYSSYWLLLRANRLVADMGRVIALFFIWILMRKMGLVWFLVMLVALFFFLVSGNNGRPIQ